MRRRMPKHPEFRFYAFANLYGESYVSVGTCTITQSKVLDKYLQIHIGLLRLKFAAIRPKERNYSHLTVCRTCTRMVDGILW